MKLLSTRNEASTSGTVTTLTSFELYLYMQGHINQVDYTGVSLIALG